MAITSLRFAGSEYVDLAEHTYMWILIVRLEVSGAQDDGKVIDAIIGAPQYGHDFAAPFDGAASPIAPRSSRPLVAQPHHCRPIPNMRGRARYGSDPVLGRGSALMDAGFTQPLEVQRRLSDVYALLRSGRVYELDNSPAECEHDYGWVMGGAGFHEFAVIDGTGHTASLVVTCDD